MGEFRASSGKRSIKLQGTIFFRLIKYQITDMIPITNIT